MDVSRELELSDPREEIAQLEARIEELSAKLETCRKISVAARAAVAVGGLLLVAVMVGAVRSDAMSISLGVVATIGGLVLLGSNRSSADVAAQHLATAEARRVELINQIDIRVVSQPGAVKIH